MRQKKASHRVKLVQMGLQQLNRGYLFVLCVSRDLKELVVNVMLATMRSIKMNTAKPNVNYARMVTLPQRRTVIQNAKSVHLVTTDSPNLYLLWKLSLLILGTAMAMDTVPIRI